MAKNPEHFEGTRSDNYEGPFQKDGFTYYVNKATGGILLQEPTLNTPSHPQRSEYPQTATAPNHSKVSFTYEGYSENGVNAMDQLMSVLAGQAPRAVVLSQQEHAQQAQLAYGDSAQISERSQSDSWSLMGELPVGVEDVEEYNQSDNEGENTNQLSKTNETNEQERSLRSARRSYLSAVSIGTAAVLALTVYGLSEFNKGSSEGVDAANNCTESGQIDPISGTLCVGGQFFKDLNPINGIWLGKK